MVSIKKFRVVKFSKKTTTLKKILPDVCYKSIVNEPPLKTNVAVPLPLKVIVPL